MIQIRNIYRVSVFFKSSTLVEDKVRDWDAVEILQVAVLKYVW